MSGGRLFQRMDAATGNERRPSVAHSLVNLLIIILTVHPKIVIMHYTHSLRTEVNPNITLDSVIDEST